MFITGIGELVREFEDAREENISYSPIDELIILVHVFRAFLCEMLSMPIHVRVERIVIHGHIEQVFHAVTEFTHTICTKSVELREFIREINAYWRKQA